MGVGKTTKNEADACERCYEISDWLVGAAAAEKMPNQHALQSYGDTVNPKYFRSHGSRN